MKRILWVCNIMIPAIAKSRSMESSVREGWLSGIFDKLQNTKEDLTLGIAFPVTKEEFILLGKKFVYREGKKEIYCYPFYEDLGHPEEYDPSLEGYATDILEDFQPNIVHLFGTEFPHAYAFAKVFRKPNQTLLGIQGLCFRIATEYMAGLPTKVVKSKTIRDILRKDSLMEQQNKFVRRGEIEKKTIALSNVITGRTSFDREESLKINPNAKYYLMNETMRSDFYEENQGIEEAYSLFLGQGDYPLKGLHFVLEAMGRLKEKYPEMKLYIAGNSVISHQSLKDIIKLPAYGKYLLSLIRKYDLKDRVIPLGRQSSKQMRERYQKSAVILCASVLENSPNTVAEAMLLGKAVIGSEVGGIPDMIEDKKNGLLFQSGNSEDLAEKISLLFDNPQMREKLGANARETALVRHNGDKNFEVLMKIYEDMYESNLRI